VKLVLFNAFLAPCTWRSLPVYVSLSITTILLLRLGVIPYYPGFLYKLCLPDILLGLEMGFRSLLIELGLSLLVFLDLRAFLKVADWTFCRFTDSEQSLC